MKTFRKTDRKKEATEPIAPPKEESKKPSKPTYPKLHRGTLYGDCEELEDHIRVDVYVREDGLVQGGELWPKNIWRQLHGDRLPWQERPPEVDQTGGIAYNL